MPSPEPLVGQSGIASRLPHPSGANVDNPRIDLLLRVRYVDGEWSVWNVDGGGEPTRKRGVLPFEVAQAFTENAKIITAEVVRNNHRMWAEALEIRLQQEHDRATAKGKDAIAQARALKEALTP